MTIALQHILINPTHTGCIRANGRCDAGGQPARDIVEGFQHTASGPVKIGSIFKNDVYKGEAEKRVTAHYLGVGHREHGCGQGIGHLILHHLGGLPRILCKNNHLHVGKIRDGVQRSLQQGVGAAGDDENGGQHHQEFVLDGGVNNFADHFYSSRDLFVAAV